MIYLLGYLLSISAHAESVKSDCAPAEMQVIKNPGFVQHVAQGRLMSVDCAVAPKGRVYIAYVINVPSGVESYLVVVNRKGLTVSSLPVFVSRPLGFDAFPMAVEKNHRLIFVKSEHVVYLNIQTGPATTQLARWDLDVEAQKLFTSPKATWPMTAGHLPKLFEENGQWKAKVNKQTVNL